MVRPPITIGRATLTRHRDLLVSGVWPFRCTGVALQVPFGGADDDRAAAGAGRERRQPLRLGRAERRIRNRVLPGAGAVRRRTGVRRLQGLGRREEEGEPSETEGEGWGGAASSRMQGEDKRGAL